MNKKLVSLDKFRLDKTKAKTLATGDSKEVGKLFSDDLSTQFNNILKEQRRKTNDERHKSDF